MRLEYCARVVAPRRPFAMAGKTPRSGADCHTYLSLSIATESHMDGGLKKRRPTRSSVQGDDAEGADPPKMKQQVISDPGKQVVIKRRAEELDPTERKRKAAAAAPSERSSCRQGGLACH